MAVPIERKRWSERHLEVKINRFGNGLDMEGEGKGRIKDNIYIRVEVVKFAEWGDSTG